MNIFTNLYERIKDFGMALGDNLSSVIIGLVLLLLLILFRKKLADWISRGVSKAFQKWPVAASGLNTSLRGPLRAFFPIFGLYLLVQIIQPSAGHIVFSTSFMALTVKLFRIANICLVAWAMMNFTPFATSLSLKANKDRKDISSITTSAVAIKFVANVLRIVIVSLAVVIVISELGYNINGIITGLGLGGLTFSLAAKNTASNLFAGFEIVTDRPFDVGDYIKTPSGEGTVEDMTMRSTRIRTADDLLVSVPNAVLMNEPITNYSEMGKRCKNMYIGLTYDTPTNVMHKCIKDIDAMLHADKDVDNERIVVRFDGFGDSSLDIRILYFTVTTNYDEALKVNENINFKIREIVEKNGASFAFPSTTLYVKEDGKNGLT